MPGTLAPFRSPGGRYIFRRKEIFSYPAWPHEAPFREKCGIEHQAINLVRVKKEIE